jgi:hypothetical protein
MSAASNKNLLSPHGILQSLVVFFQASLKRLPFFMNTIAEIIASFGIIAILTLLLTIS